MSCLISVSLRGVRPAPSGAQDDIDGNGAQVTEWVVQWHSPRHATWVVLSSCSRTFGLRPFPIEAEFPFQINC